MVVMEHSADTYQVDLCQLPGDAQDSDVPVSVRDALVFLEHAYFIAEMKPKVIYLASFGVQFYLQLFCCMGL
jgi:hypothetical protein